MPPKGIKEKNTDIWLTMVILVLVLAFGGGLWMTGKSLDARLDELDARLRGQSSNVQTELFTLRKEVQDLAAWTRQAAKCRAENEKPAEDE